MNNAVRRIIMERKDNANKRDYAYDRDMARFGADNYDSAYNRGYDRGYDNGYEKGYDQAHYMDTEDSADGRRGVRGTGRYGIGGSRYYGRRDRASENEIKLSETDIKEWKQNLSKGEHFSMPKIEQAMQTMNIHPQDYTAEELYMVANALYSDYYDTFKNVISSDKEAMYYTKMAKDFLEDKDSAIKGSEKLAVYYYCIVKED